MTSPDSATRRIPRGDSGLPVSISMTICDQESTANHSASHIVSTWETLVFLTVQELKLPSTTPIYIVDNIRKMDLSSTLAHRVGHTVEADL